MGSVSSEALSSSDMLRVCVSPALDKGLRERGSAGALGQGVGTAGARLADSQWFEAGGGGGVWCSPTRQLGEPGWGPRPRLPSVPPSCSHPVGGGWGADGAQGQTATWGGGGCPPKSQGRAWLLTLGYLTLSTLPFPTRGLNRVLQREGYTALAPGRLL